MTVTVASKKIEIDPISSLTAGMFMWRGRAYGTGDGSGGNVDMALHFDSFNLFGGQWYFTLENFTCYSIGDLGSNGILTLSIEGRTWGQITPEYYRRYDISRYEGQIFGQEAAPPKYLWKPREYSSLPQVRGVFYPNINLQSYCFQAYGFIAMEGSPASLLLACR